MRWIKASELPNNGVYIFRVIGNIHTARPYVVNEYSRKVCHNELLSIENAFSVRLTELEYLDESTPASIKDEAKALYPYDETREAGTSEWGIDQEITDMQRSAHITCARMYVDTIEKLTDHNHKLMAENDTTSEVYGETKDLFEACKSANELLAGEIERLKGENEKMRRVLDGIAAVAGGPVMPSFAVLKDFYLAATEALKTT